MVRAGLMTRMPERRVTHAVVPASCPRSAEELETFVLDGLFFDRRPAFLVDTDGKGWQSMAIVHARDKTPVMVRATRDGYVIEYEGREVGPQALEMVEALREFLGDR